MNFVYAFLIGGGICVIGQLLLSLTKLSSARILVLFVVLGVALGALGLYEPLAELAGAGATVPLTGFGYLLADGALQGARTAGVLGAITGGVKAAAAGIAAAIVLGYIFGAIFKPHTK